MMFKELHHQEQPLILCNVWDAPSTAIAEKLGFSAIGTSSAAIASSLGKKDGEDLEFEDVINVVKSIAKVSNLPLTVDIEAGYGKSGIETAHNILSLSELGVVGINIEDSVVTQGVRQLLDPVEFSKKLRIIKQCLKEQNIEMFINVRTDTFLLNIPQKVESTLERISYYENAGADGIFVPCLTKSEDIKTIIESTELPLNLMCMPDLPNFKTLGELGVKRISMGNFIYDAMLLNLSSHLKAITAKQSFSPIFV